MIATGLALPTKPQQMNVGGVMSMKPLSTVLAEEAAAASARTASSPMDAVVSSLSALIRQHWSAAKGAKADVEEQMLSAVRARRGEYDPDVLSQIKGQGGSEIYMLVFATKARQLKALISDIMVGSGGDKPWTLRPTPKPELPPDAKDQILRGVHEEVYQAEMAGAPMSTDEVRQRLVDVKNAVAQRILEAARAEAERAEAIVEDALLEGGYLEALDQFVDDLTTFKTAFVKGPIVRRTNQLAWQQGADGAYTAQVTEALSTSYERGDPFMIYPAPWSRGVDDAYLIERHRLNRGALESLIGVEGYDEKAIRKVLDEYGTGGLREWLAIDTSKAAAEGRSAQGEMRDDLIDALQYWGSVSGKMLREWGLGETEVPDEAKEYEVECWLIGEHVIKALINQDPLKRRPYYADGFSRVPGAFWHNSLFDVTRDCQNMCNAAARALANNLGISSGPQVVVNVDRVPPGEDITEMYPWKVWQTTNDPAGSSAKPIDFFQPGSNAQELMGIFERFSSMADEYSGIPKYMAGMAGGEGGAGRTASGMSMMITNASKQIKHTLASIDLRVITLMVERQYQHALMYQPEEALAGDLKIVARGALSLVAKEAAQVRLNEFMAATGNPVDMQIIGMDGRAELLRHAVKRLDINADRVVPSTSAVKARAAQAQAMAQAQAQAQGQQPGAPAGNGQQLMDGAPVTDTFSPTGAA